MLWFGRAERIARRADKWVARSAGLLSEADIAERDAWRGTDPRHERAWLRARAIWSATEGMPRPQRASAPAPYRRGFEPRFALASLAVVIAAGGGAYLIERRVAFKQPIPAAEWVTASRGDHIRLADGTMVDLDPGSALRADVAGPIRSVRLARGTAVFEVVHDATRPFVVSAADRKIVAIGTRFEVALRPQGVEVTLLQGTIEVSARASAPGDAPVRMRRGQRLTIVGGRRTMATVPLDDGATPTIAADVDPTPVEGILARANRAASVPIRLADPSLASRKIEGRFDTGDTKALAAQLGAALDLSVERRDGAYWLVAERAGSPAPS